MFPDGGEVPWWDKEPHMTSETISINRAPVLTLWAAVVAQRLGFDEDEALTLGKAVAGLNAQAKGRRLGIFKPHEENAKQAREKEQGERLWIEVLGRFEDGMVEMTPGDFVNFPAHRKHRVERTTPEEPTIWLAVFCEKVRRSSDH
jgi:hypothetical protein